MRKPRRKAPESAHAKSTDVDAQAKRLAQKFQEYFFLKERSWANRKRAEKGAQDDGDGGVDRWQLAPEPVRSCILRAETIDSRLWTARRPFFRPVGKPVGEFMGVIISHRITFYKNLTTRNKSIER